ncbi:redoxin [Kribbella sp. VKM Ac-2527]|uniref:Redoxin n=1 Tax=Kribbella caucasensis TaxID=2512215 RepID=A0A4R6J3D5_9ACTN|nr:redoxin family protein [Kribbella sp. VKM Ac-2527]TDO29850.1 redoxin [Kribbella sp. VKM Ac-2527]
MRFRRPLPTTAALLALLTLAACGPDNAGPSAGATPTASSPTTSSTPGTPPSSPSPGKPAIGQLGFTGTTLAGKSFNAATMAGKPVLLWFWAPWCPTCMAEAPDVLNIQQAYAGRIGIVGVAGLDEQNNMQPFVDRTKTGALTHLADPDGEIWRRFEVTQQSTYVLLDTSGNVSFKGVLGGDELRDKVAALAG